jgi:excisionase family DNA binding protein
MTAPHAGGVALAVRLSVAPEVNLMSIQTEPERGYEPRIGRSVSLDHAAELLGVSRRTIYNRIREGRLQTIRTIGGSQRVLLDSVQETRDRTDTHN